MSAKVPRISKTCPSCGGTFSTTQSRLDAGRGTVCSRACNAKFHLTKHGHTADASVSPTYMSWVAMVSRCTRPGATKYAQYGGRGITVIDEWTDFANFLRDMGERPEGTSIDRIDGKLGYFKENCRWATSRQQMDNIRTARVVTYQEQDMTLTQLSILLGVSKGTLIHRIKSGWPEGAWGSAPDIGDRSRRANPRSP